MSSRSEWDAALDSARGAYPDIALPPETFHAFVTERQAGEPLERLRIADLYLACASAHRDPAALRALEGKYFAGLRAAIAAVRGAQVDEALQYVRSKLLDAKVPAQTGIWQYRGRGELSRWLKTIGVRAAIDSARGASREVPVGDEALLDAAVPSEDPEVEHMKRSYGAVFREALRDGISSLSPEARLDLKLYYLDGLGVQELGALNGVAISTVSRRLAKARKELLDATRTAMRKRLKAGARDVDSILKVIASRLELSRSRFES